MAIDVGDETVANNDGIRHDVDPQRENERAHDGSNQPPVDEKCW